VRVCMCMFVCMCMCACVCVSLNSSITLANTPLHEYQSFGVIQFMAVTLIQRQGKKNWAHDKQHKQYCLHHLYPAHACIPTVVAYDQAKNIIYVHL